MYEITDKELEYHARSELIWNKFKLNSKKYWSGEWKNGKI